MVIRLLKDRLEPLCGQLLTLRPLRWEDTERYAAAKWGAVAWNAKGEPDREAMAEAVANAMRDRNRYDFLLLARGEQVIGEAALREIDWEMESGRGSVLLFGQAGPEFGEEGLALLLRFAFERLCLHRFEAEARGGDLRWQNTLERAGFRREGVRREALWLDGRYRDLALYSMLDREYQGYGRA